MNKIIFITLFISNIIYSIETTDPNQALNYKPYPQVNPYANQTIGFVDKNNEFIQAQYLGITPQQSLLILEIKTEFLKELIEMDIDASQKDKDKLLAIYQTRVGELLLKFSKENGGMGLPQNPGMGIRFSEMRNPQYIRNGMGIGFGDGFCTPNDADQSLCQTPDGRVYKLNYASPGEGIEQEVECKAFTDNILS